MFDRIYNYFQELLVETLWTGFWEGFWGALAFGLFVGLILGYLLMKFNARQFAKERAKYVRID